MCVLPFPRLIRQLVPILAAVAIGTPAFGAIVARFDLGTTGSQVASGWEQVAVGVQSDNLTSVSGTQNGITVQLGASTVFDARDRGVNATLHNNPTLNPGGILDPVLRDWLFDNINSTAGDFTVDFTGLEPDTPYEITAIHLETSGGQSTFVTDWYEGSDSSGTLLGAWNGGRTAPLAATDFVDLNVTSDAAGELSLFMDPTTGPPRLNGFIVNQIPEPGSLVLVGLGGLLLLRRQRP